MKPQGGSGDDPKGSKPKDVKYSPFTVDAADSGVQQMPTISSLLNRKKATKAGAGSRSFSQPIIGKKGEKTQTQTVSKGFHAPQSKSIEQHAHPAHPTHKDEISLKFETHDASSPAQIETSAPPPTATSASQVVEVAAAVKVQPSRRQKRTNTQTGQNLLVWTQEELKASSDPLAKFILQTMTEGATQGLFLSIDIPEGAQVPEFASTAFFGTGELVQVWTGLRWNPRITPDLWRALINEGIVEFPPPGTGTIASSERNVTRNALAAPSNSHLLIVRVGPAKACRGLLVIFSPKSMIQIARAYQSQIFSPIQATQISKIQKAA